MKTKNVMLSLMLGMAVWSVQAQTVHQHEPVAASSDSASTLEYRESMQRMHQDMDIAYTNDADADFVRGMLPHHQAAVAMAKTQLKYGKDPELRQLSHEIVAAQEREIALLQHWLKAHEAYSHQHQH